jgi:hypothetical protein
VDGIKHGAFHIAALVLVRRGGEGYNNRWLEGVVGNEARGLTLASRIETEGVNWDGWAGLLGEA